MRQYGIFLSLILSGIALLASCSQQGPPRLPDGRLIGTYDDFTNRADYRDTRDVWYSDGRLDNATPKTSKVVIHLDSQRGKLYVNNEIAMDFPVCTGKHRYETPRGTFKIIEQKKHHSSGSYGSVYNSSGNIAVADARPSTPVPKGGKYVPASMPLWMRLHGGVGMHVGRVYRDADSHGCIRIPPEPCEILFEKVGLATTVVVKN